MTATPVTPAPRSPLRTILLVVGSLVLVAVIGYIVVAVVANATRTDASRVVEIADPYSGIVVDSEVVDVTVEFAAVTETSVDFRQNDSTRSFEFDAALVGSTLEVRVVDHWSGLWLPFGNASSPTLVLTLPEELFGVDLDITTGVGDVVIDGDLGALAVNSGVGDLRLEGSAARATIESGVGDVTARSYRVDGSLIVETGTGDARLDLASVPDALTVSSGVGDQTVTLPAGSYRIETESGVGEVTVSADSDPDASTVMRFDSGVGDITVAN